MTTRNEQLKRTRMSIAEVGENSDATTSYLKLRCACLAFGMTLFHTTPEENVESIKHSGLRPIAGSVPKPIVGKPNDYPVDGVFLGNFAAAHRLSQDWSKAQGRPYAILEIHLAKGTVVYDDPVMPGESVIVDKVHRRNLYALTPTDVAIRSQMKAANMDLNRLFSGSHE